MSAQAANERDDAIMEAEATKDLFRPIGVIQTASGEAYDFANPRVEAIKLTDIAHALSNMCRFAGHTKRFYSVAEHCVLVSRILEAQGASRFIQAVGLLHDAHEAYVWDCPRPLKPLLGDVFSELADKADAVICEALSTDGLGDPLLHPELFHAACIKNADDRALVFEANDLMHHGTQHWSDTYRDIPRELPAGMHLENYKPWRFRDTWESGQLGKIPPQAESAWLSRCGELGVH